MADEKVFEQELYKKTSGSIKEVVKTLPTYAEIMQSFNAGENEVELRKRFMLKKLDESWIIAIEDCLPALDQIIRNPQFRLQEKEEVLPVEISKHINGRSVIHLSQHTDMINEVRDDGSVVPSKLLNVFQEDTVLTYENKFINTLVNRLYAFVAIRYNGAKECGEDEKRTILNMKQEFEHKEFSGKINVSIEIDQAPGDHEVIKNYVYTSDLWKRMEKLNTIINEYMASPFIVNMGRNFIHPPVLRTNTILKNPLFKDCLSLWEFIEGYENTGYEAMVQEDLITASDELLEDMYNSIAEQYVLFQTHILNGFEEEKALDSRLLKVNPRIKDLFDTLNEDEFDYKTLIPSILKTEGTLEYPDNEIELAIKVALAADAMSWHDELEDVESIIDEQGNIEYKYKFSVIARLIKAQLPTQDYYNEIRNDLLSYKGVKSLLSWSRDLYKCGRKQCAKLNVKGKTLFVYLPLDPKAYDADHYHHLDVSKEGKEVDYPFLLKVRSPRACKYAKELIEIVMNSHGLVKDEKYKARDYHLPEMSLEELLERDLARPLDKNGPWSFDWNLNKEGFEYKYIYSFIAKLIRSGEERQEFYNEIKNYLLSFKPIKSKISWPRELFRAGREKVCQLKVKGKTLCVYLPLNPTKFDVEHFHHEDVRVKGKENEFGLMLRVKSNLAVKHAKELIDVVMANLGLVRIEGYEAQNYKFAFKPLEQLLAEDLARLVGAKAPEKKPVEVKPEPVVAEEGDEGFEYKYKFSFSARLIRSGEERQNFYNAVKNNILSYKKVTSKISWGHELFKLGRIKISVLKVKGKTLCVYLPLDPSKYDQDRLHFIDLREEGKEVEFPMLMKVKSDRAVKYVTELIKDVMANNGIELNENYVEQDYKLPYMSIEQMLVSDPVLAKLIHSEQPVFESKPVEVEPVEEEAPVVEEIIEVPAFDENEDEEGINYKYKFSFSARLIRAGMLKQDFYNEIKNELLSYKKVNSKISWNHEFFKLGRKKCALMKVKGKTLCVYLPLDPSKYDQNRLYFQDLRVEGKEVEFPMLMKVKSDRGVKYVKELIADVMANFEIAKNEAYEPVNYRMKEISLEKMLSMDPPLAKYIEHALNPFEIKEKVVEEEVEEEPNVEEEIKVEEPVVTELETKVEEPIEESAKTDVVPSLEYLREQLDSPEVPVEEEPVVGAPVDEETSVEEPVVEETPIVEEQPEEVLSEQEPVEAVPVVEESTIVDEPVIEETIKEEIPVVEETPIIEEQPVEVESYDEIVEEVKPVQSVSYDYDDDYEEPGFNSPLNNRTTHAESYEEPAQVSNTQSSNIDDYSEDLSDLMKGSK